VLQRRALLEPVPAPGLEKSRLEAGSSRRLEAIGSISAKFPQILSDIIKIFRNSLQNSRCSGNSPQFPAIPAKFREI